MPQHGWLSSEVGRKFVGASDQQIGPGFSADIQIDLTVARNGEDVEYARRLSLID